MLRPVGKPFCFGPCATFGAGGSGCPGVPPPTAAARRPVEGSGELEYFNTNRDDHPTIVRALSDHANPKRKDEMPEYENILFNPITRSLEE